MQETLILDVAGVPEHFNLPWRLLEEDPETPIRVRWRDVPEGTGAMVQMLEAGDCDVALLLSEGAVAGIANGAHYKILGCYVASPLRWGVHVNASTRFCDADDIKGARFAISRYGSGSHLMAGVYAAQRRWPDQPLEFVVVNNLNGARQALASGEGEIFLWEQFTTQPYVDNGEFRRVDVIPTPWPCFVACLSERAMPKYETALSALKMALDRAARLQRDENAVSLFAERYSLQATDVAAWLRQTEWSPDGTIPEGLLAQINTALLDVGMISKAPTAKQVFVQGETMDSLVGTKTQKAPSN